MLDGGVRGERGIHTDVRIDGGRRAFRIHDEVVEGQNVNLLGLEPLVVPSKLFAVEAHAPVVPHVRPVLPHAFVFGLQGLAEVGVGFCSTLSQVLERAIGSLDGVTEDGDQPYIRDVVPDPIRRVLAVKVRDRGFTDGHSRLRALEKLHIAVDVGHPSGPRSPRDATRRLLVLV